MTTPTTTYHTIREKWITVIEALTPSQLSRGFRVYRGGEGEWRDWARSTQGSGALRRFWIKASGDQEPMPATDGDVEAMAPGAAVLEIAYPHSWAEYRRSGTRLNYHDLESVAVDDANQIRDAIGVNGGANYVSGQSRCDADPQDDLEDDEGVSFKVINLSFLFNRSVT